MERILLAFIFATVAAGTPTYGSVRQAEAVQRCLKKWGDHPFGENPMFQVYTPTVRVMGLGSSAPLFDKATEKPELVFVEPAVSVMSKTTFKMRNPNGWYCFDSTVGVMSRIIFDMACDAHVADSRADTQVAAVSDEGGVVVLGSIRVRRHCERSQEPKPVTEIPPAKNEPERPKHF